MTWFKPLLLHSWIFLITSWSPASILCSLMNSKCLEQYLAHRGKYVFNISVVILTSSSVLLSRFFSWFIFWVYIHHGRRGSATQNPTPLHILGNCRHQKEAAPFHHKTRNPNYLLHQLPWHTTRFGQSHVPPRIVTGNWERGFSVAFCLFWW